MYVVAFLRLWRNCIAVPPPRDRWSRWPSSRQSVSFKNAIKIYLYQGRFNMGNLLCVHMNICTLTRWYYIAGIVQRGMRAKEVSFLNSWAVESASGRIYRTLVTWGETRPCRFQKHSRNVPWHTLDVRNDLAFNTRAVKPALTWLFDSDITGGRPRNKRKHTRTRTHSLNTTSRRRTSVGKENRQFTSFR